jgi:hypothetical protein
MGIYCKNNLLEFSWRVSTAGLQISHSASILPLDARATSLAGVVLEYSFHQPKDHTP